MFHYIFVVVFEGEPMQQVYNNYLDDSYLLRVTVCQATSLAFEELVTELGMPPAPKKTKGLATVLTFWGL